MARICICKICKEPIWNFICPDCLAENIRKTIPGSFLGRFSAFHSKFSAFFGSVFDAQEMCIKCGNPQTTAVCMHCYITEVLAWLKNESPQVEKHLEPLLNYGFDKHEEFIGSIMAEPVTRNNNYITDSGICDECGEYSEKLLLVNGEWVCRDCMQGTEFELLEE